jgi:hypothetical protein
MSVRVMTQAWATELPAGEKLVLLALADCANDEGKCWPGLASLCRKTGRCKRSLQESLRILDKSGHITRTENPGKGMNYEVHPVAKSAPVADHATGSKKTCKPVAKSAPKPSRTVIASEAKASSARRAAYPPPPGVPFEVWSDYLKLRQAKRARMSDTAYRRQIAKLTQLADDGHPPGEVVAQSVEHGWTGFFPLKADRNDHIDPTFDALNRFQQLVGNVGAGAGAGEMPEAGGPGLDGL